MQSWVKPEVDPPISYALPRDSFAVLILNLPPSIESLESNAGHGKAYLEDSKGTFLTSSRVLECQQFDHQFFLISFQSPSGCPTGVVRVSLEMITKILLAIQAATRCFRPQTQFPSRFARQSEFSF